VLTNTFTGWIYAQFIAVDANFKLKSKNRQIKDPELGSGWSYFVENTPYVQHVANNPHEKDVRVFQIAWGYILICFLGYELRQRIPRCQSGELTWWQRLYCQRRGQGGLRTTLLCPSQCRGRFATRGTVCSSDCIWDIANNIPGISTPITSLLRISSVVKYATSKYHTISHASGRSTCTLDLRTTMRMLTLQPSPSPTSSPSFTCLRMAPNPSTTPVGWGAHMVKQSSKNGLISTLPHFPQGRWALVRVTLH
jgi:hypothetical protein